MFGDRDAYNDKFKTCARARPYGEQILGSDYYRKEHTKPLMSKHSVLNIYNLHHYCCALMCLKILKFRSPISLYSMFKLSSRKQTMLILPRGIKTMVYMFSKIWNEVRKILSVEDFSVSSSSLKSSAKSFLLARQHRNNPIEWDQTNLMGFYGTTAEGCYWQHVSIILPYSPRRA